MALVLAAGLGGSAMASDLPPLSEDDYINSQLFAGAVSTAVGEFCPTMTLRKVKAGLAALSLFNHARGLGYSRTEIENYVNDPANKKILADQLRAHLEARGVAEDDPESFCVVGREEIANNTVAGSLLRGQ